MISYNKLFELLNGIEIGRQSIEEGNKVIKPADLTCEGYLFVGWYKDNGFKELFDLDSLIEEDTIFYAMWGRK